MCSKFLVVQADRNTKIQVIIDVTYLTGKLLRLGRILDRSVDSRLFVEIWGRGTGGGGKEGEEEEERKGFLQVVTLCLY